MLNLLKNDLIFFFPEIYLTLIIIFFIIFFVIFGEGLLYNKPYLLNLGSKIFIFVILIEFILLNNNILFDVIIFNFSFISNYFTNIIKIFILISLFFVILISFNYYRYENFNNYEYLLMLITSILGMFLLVSSNDLIALYLSLELQSLSFYTLATLKRNSKFSTEAGLKYFILGSFSSALILYGSSFLYGFTGFTNFIDFFTFDLNFIMINDLFMFNGIILGLILLISGIFFKIGLVPFHSWVPDVYEGSPSIITLIFSTIPKIAMLSVLIRFIYEIFFNFLPFWNYLLIIVSCLSIFIGTVSALFQLKFKRIMAYSGIGHAGYMTLALSFGDISGLHSFFIYLIIYVILSFNLFSFFIFIRKKNSKLKMKKITDLEGLFNYNPLLSFLFLIPLFSIAGIPPLLGFFGKAIFFFIIMNKGYYFIAIFCFLMSVVSAFFYIRIIKIMFFSKKKEWLYLNDLNMLESYIIAFFSFLSIFICLYPSLIIDFSFSLAINFYQFL